MSSCAVWCCVVCLAWLALVWCPHAWGWPWQAAVAHQMLQHSAACQHTQQPCMLLCPAVAPLIQYHAPYCTTVAICQLSAKDVTCCHQACLSCECLLGLLGLIQQSPGLPAALCAASSVCITNRPASLSEHFCATHTTAHDDAGSLLSKQETAPAASF